MNDEPVDNLLSPLAEKVVTDYATEFLKTVDAIENPSENKKVMDLGGYSEQFLNYIKQLEDRDEGDEHHDSTP